MSNAERLMIARLSMSRWQPRKFDRKATEELANLHNADPKEIGRFNKLLIDPVAMRPLDSAMNSLRSDHYRMTSPWDDEGARVLPTELYFDYTKMANTARSKIERLAATFAQEAYPEQRELARKRLNSLFSADDYPSADEVQHRFSASVRFEPLPNPEDTRVWGIGAVAVKQIKRELEASINERLQAAQSHVIERVQERAQEFIDRMRTYQAGESRSVHASVIENLREVTATVLNGLNITGDPKFTKIAQELADAIDGLKIEQLRTNETLRRGKIDEVNAVAKKFAGVFPGGAK